MRSPFLALFLVLASLVGCAFPVRAAEPALLYTYTLPESGTPTAYDEALAVASLQGIINRDSPELYVLTRNNGRPQFWLDILTRNDRWLQGREQKPIANLDGLAKLAGKRLKGVVIWDPSVPATANVATTMAGVQDVVVLSPDLAERFQKDWKLPVVKDLRGMFTGAETGSKKNDAYRWAIREYLAKGKCSSRLLCLFEDSWTARARGDVSYAVTRDWAVKNRAFVFDLSPWGDEKPADDPEQKTGLDLETYRMILAETQRQAAGKHMTEMTGFFVGPKYADDGGRKSAHQGVPTEWETVWLISPFNCYQNTISSDCYNQSLHSQAPRRPLKQKAAAPAIALEKKAYICVLMADYDSATPLYDFLPSHWQSPDRGKIPLAWGINPNLLDTYPDLIAYYYETATPADTFTSDASAAGYMNPNRVGKESLPLFTRHNLKYFGEADMSIAPMILDQNEPSPDVKDAFSQFAPGGFATIVDDMHRQGGHLPAPQVWKGMPVMELVNEACNSNTSTAIAGVFWNVIQRRGNPQPGFHLFRCVWISPTTIKDAVAELQRQHPDLKVEVLPPHAFFALLKTSLTATK